MSAPKERPALTEVADILNVGLKMQQEGLRRLYEEIRALQAMIPLGERELPTDAETEEGFDNMPV